MQNTLHSGDMTDWGNVFFGATLAIALSIAWLNRISGRKIDSKYRRCEVFQTIRDIECMIQEDVGNRGIKEILLPPGELLQAAQCLKDSKSVAIITGFPCMIDFDPPTETDGPLGAMAIARAILRMGKRVIILTDQCNEEVLLACAAGSGLAAISAEQPGGSFRLESFPPSSAMEEADLIRLEEVREEIDLVVAVERAGPNREGRYLTMRCSTRTQQNTYFNIFLGFHSGSVI